MRLVAFRKHLFVTKAKGEIMRFEADTHSHTLASGHAYNTMNETC